jgi:hypothetical protein
MTQTAPPPSALQPPLQPRSVPDRSLWIIGGILLLAVVAIVAIFVSGITNQTSAAHVNVSTKRVVSFDPGQLVSGVPASDPQFDAIGRLQAYPVTALVGGVEHMANYMRIGRTCPSGLECQSSPSDGAKAFQYVTTAPDFTVAGLTYHWPARLIPTGTLGDHYVATGGEKLADIISRYRALGEPTDQVTVSDNNGSKIVTNDMRLVAGETVAFG